MKHTIDTEYYPGWTRKAVSFTIDDGSVANDRKWLSYMRPAGIKGTFNLCSQNLSQLPSREDYAAFYRGYGIANHVKYHPFCFSDSGVPEIKNEAFDAETADENCIYPVPDVEGLYYFHRPNGWRRATDAEHYIRFAEESREELSDFFGFPVTEFVWPFFKQPNAKVAAWVETSPAYESARVVGAEGDKDGFAVPEDRRNWVYDADVRNLAEISALYESYPDNGILTCMIVGVHSADYERAGRWDRVEDFCRRFGNQPERYWSAPVRDLFRYADAARGVEITDDKIVNPSEIDLFITVDGKRVSLPAKSEYVF